MATRKTTKTSSSSSSNSRKKTTSSAKKAANSTAKYSIVLFGIGIFLLALTFVEGASVWAFVRQNILFGIFGISSYIIAPCVLYIATIMALEKKLTLNILKCVLAVIVLSSALLVFSDIDIASYGLFDGIAHLHSVSNLDFGIAPGVVGGFLGWPLVLLCGRPAANIIFIIFIIISIMIVFGITPAEVYHFVMGNAGKVKNTIGDIDKSNQKRIEDRKIKLQEIERQRQIERDRQEEETLANMMQSEQNRNKIDEEYANSQVMHIVNGGVVPDTAAFNKAKAARQNSSIDIDIEPPPDVTLNVITEDEIVIGPGGTFGLDPNASKSKFIRPDYAFGSIISHASSGAVEETVQSASTSAEKEEIVPLAVNTNEKTENTLELMAQKAVSAAKSTMAEDIQTLVDTPIGNYVFPPITLFQKQPKTNDDNMHSELTYKGDLLVKTLASFGVQTKILDISRGPSVTRYELQPLAGVKISRITGLSDDIALNLATMGVRIEAPIPGKAAVGIEIPNENRTAVNFRSILEDKAFKSKKEPLTFAVGKDIAGQVIVGNLAKMPHLLIAGTTGSGKSVCTNAIIMSFLYRCAPEMMRMILIDPKMVEFAQYNGIPHLLMPVVTEPRKAAGALGSAVAEMEKRYLLLAQNGVPNIEEFNLLAEEDETLEKLPYIVIVIDELADLMMVASKEVEEYICRIAQKARAAGMHLIIATQRPSVDVITGLIKANIPSRIGLSVMSQIDSRTILDTGGAEKLLGNGDMLYMPVGTNKPVRVQGAFIRSSEIRGVIDFLKKNSDSDYNEDMIAEMEKRATAEKGAAQSRDDDSEDPMFKTAVEVIIDAGQASTSLLQRRCKLGYARAARIMDEMEQAGIIGPSEGSKPRQILISRQQWIEMSMRENTQSEED